MITPMLTRRRALLAGAALPAAAALAPMLAPRRAQAAAEMQGAGFAPFHRFMLGDFEVTTLLSGSRVVEEPGNIFGLNVEADEFAAVSDAALIPADRAQFFFTPTLVNTGAELVLLDAGLTPEGIADALTAAGYAPEQVDVVVLTHMHGDHIGGTMTDGAPTFPNARYVTGAVEHNHWSAAGNELFDRNVAPLNDRTTFLDDGGTVVGGITAMAAFGHTPGHIAYMIESGGRTLVAIADTTNHYLWSLAHPDWEVSFDMDRAAAIAARRQLLGMLAADRIPFIGYHMPFPAVGYVATEGEGFRYLPGSYQMMLGGL